MKKIISLVGIVAIMLSMTLTAFAGSIPEDLLHSDEAQIFFAEVLAYHPDKENPDIEVSPVKVIKGDVKTGTKQIYYKPNPYGNLDVKAGNVYLFTYYDENNTTDIFDVTSYDTSTLKLKNVSGDMWERFEQYLNDGKYEKAEQERTGVGKQMNFAEFLYSEPLSDSDVDKITFRIQDELHEVDKDKFKKIAQDNIPTPEELPEGDDESLDMIPPISKKTFAGWIVGGIMVVFVLSIVIGFAIKKKKGR